MNNPRLAATNLVDGYLVQAPRADEVTHYAVFADGTIKRTRRTIKHNHHSFNQNFAWEVAHALPDTAEYIGRYPANM